MAVITQMRDPVFRLFVLAAAAAWIWFSRVPAGLDSSRRLSAPQTGFLAPDFTLSAADGTTVTLSELRGKAVLINFWASWCAPCRAEMPAIQDVFHRYLEDGFIVLAVNVTSQDTEEAALSFAAAHGLTFPILMDRDGAVALMYENRALPSSFFVDSEGLIRDVVIGGPMAEALLLTRVEDLLEAGGP